MNDLINRSKPNNLIATHSYLQKHVKESAELNKKLASGTKIYSSEVDPLGTSNFNKLDATSKAVAALDAAIRSSVNTMKHSVDVLEQANEILMDMKSVVMQGLSDSDNIELQMSVNNTLASFNHDLGNLLKKHIVNPVLVLFI